MTLKEAKNKFYKQLNDIQTALEKERQRRKALKIGYIQVLKKENNPVLAVETANIEHDEAILEEYCKVCQHAVIFNADLIRALSTYHYRNEAIKWLKWTKTHCIDTLKELGELSDS